MELATRSDNQIDAPKGHRRPRRHGVSRPSRRRYWLRRAGVVMVVFLLWLAWSIGGALRAPGTDGTDARLAEWARFHALGWAVDDLEQVQYQLSPPKVGGSLAGGIPELSTPQLKPSLRGGSTPATPSIDALVPIPPQTQPALPEEPPELIYESEVRPDAEAEREAEAEAAEEESSKDDEKKASS